MDLYNFGSWDIYSNKSRYKVLIMVIALVIGGASIWYTHILVNRLASRESKLIDLYAKGIKALVETSENNDVNFLFNEIIEANESIPVILTDEKFNPISERNVRIPKNATLKEKDNILRKEIIAMRAVHEPLEVELAPGFKNYIFYRNSFLLTQLLYYPYVQLTIIGIFVVIAYLAFSYSRNAEQNRVWVGLAKETAHQLGTPISSLMAWLELFKQDPKFKDDPVVVELEKDVERLERVTARFSNIGSEPTLIPEPVADIITDVVNYLKVRISTKVKFYVIANIEQKDKALINKPLFEWVIENICKNAVDAMNGVGEIRVYISTLGKMAAIDISDTGKGIPRSRINDVFKPGYTTKRRGWGLGLTLVKRIVETYHGGRIFVLNSEPGKGTTFRILIRLADLSKIQENEPRKGRLRFEYEDDDS